ncbi:excinuclease ABC subunit UvrC [Acholeplasma sp. OttesenSCG-928-E16]|nr:excinuclease ABC subunit UvrC [Acholeplasma sp. OttesenSCG-928-E16]
MIKEKLKTLPEVPGCYLMKNQNGTIIYVGKAKNLKNRVKSYFTGAHNEKTTLLVSEIADFEYVITNSEQESLILELNLIKKNQPKFNIRLMDDKTYPYIEITDEKNPVLRVTRSALKNKRIFGPFPNSYAARETVRILNRIMPFRKCETIPKKECLYYHLGQCLAPCIIDNIDYSPFIEKTTKFLKGDDKELLQELEKKMKEASNNLEFEKAVEYRDMILNIKATTEKQIITLNDYKDRDFVSYAFNENELAIQVLMMRAGKIVDNHHLVFSYIDSPMESVINYLLQLYDKEKMPDELVFSTIFDEELVHEAFGNKAFIPKKGDKKKITELASKNAKLDLENYNLLYKSKTDSENEALEELSKLIGSKVDRIEVFDNAQIFGTAPVSAMIVYENNKFSKKEYRRYNLKTTKNDDYQAMREVVYRRYQKLLFEEKQLPDLILVDGGKGQVNSGYEALQSIGLDIKIAGLKKNDRHKLEALVYNNEVVMLDTKSNIYKLLLKISEEIHRFAITFHIQKRDKKALKSPLDEIKGIGKKRKMALLMEFKSIDEIKNASVEKLKKLGFDEKTISNLKEGLK